MFVEDPGSPPYGPFSWDKAKPYTIQQYHYKSQNKPFICFGPGNKMHLRYNSLSSYDQAGGCNHFPVGQARCDGRTTRMSDRPSHCMGFPISDPVVHEEGDRYYWCGLYGMNTLDMDQLVEFGRSWAYAPELSVTSSGAVSHGFDRSRKCYQLQNTTEKPNNITLTVAGSKDSPIHNPAFHVKNWNAGGAEVFVNGEKYTDSEIGIHNKLDGTELLVFLWLKNKTQTEISIRPLNKEGM